MAVQSKQAAIEDLERKLRWAKQDIDSRNEQIQDLKDQVELTKENANKWERSSREHFDALRAQLDWMRYLVETITIPADKLDKIRTHQSISGDYVPGLRM